MPEEKKAKENQSEDDPLHRLIESTLRARWFLTAFFSFDFSSRRGEAFARFLFSLSCLLVSWSLYLFTLHSALSREGEFMV